MNRAAVVNLSCGGNGFAAIGVLFMLLFMLLFAPGLAAAQNVRVADSFAEKISNAPLEQPGHSCVAASTSGDTIVLAGVVHSSAACAFGSVVLKDPRLTSLPADGPCARLCGVAGFVNSVAK